MRDKKAVQSQLSKQEIRIIEQLRQHPEMMARFQSILDLAGNADGPLKTADEVEELLIQEVRQLGNMTMNQWAAQAEERVAQEIKQQDATIRSRKKKGLSGGVSLGWCRCPIGFGEAQLRAMSARYPRGWESVREDTLVDWNGC